MEKLNYPEYENKVLDDGRKLNHYCNRCSELSEGPGIGIYCRISDWMFDPWYSGCFNMGKEWAETLALNPFLNNIVCELITKQNKDKGFISGVMYIITTLLKSDPDFIKFLEK